MAHTWRHCLGLKPKKNETFDHFRWKYPLEASDLAPRQFWSLRALAFYLNQHEPLYKRQYQRVEFWSKTFHALFLTKIKRKLKFWISEHYEKIKTKFECLLLAQRECAGLYQNQISINLAQESMLICIKNRTISSFRTLEGDTVAIYLEISNLCFSGPLLEKILIFSNNGPDYWKIFPIKALIIGRSS